MTDIPTPDKIRLAMESMILSDFILETDIDIIVELMRISESATSVLQRYNSFKATPHSSFIAGMEALEKAIEALDGVAVSISLGTMLEPVIYNAKKIDRGEE